MQSRAKPDRQNPWRRACKLIWPYLKPHKMQALAGLGYLFIAVTMRIVEPWPLQYVLDHVLIADAVVSDLTPRQDMSGHDKTSLVLLSCASAVIVVAALRAFVEFKRSISFAWVGNRVVTQLRHDVFVHLQSLSPSYHAKARKGDLTVRLIGDLNMVRDVAVTALMPFVASIIMVAGMSAVMFWLNWQLALLAVSILPLFWFSATRSSRRIHDAAKQQRSREGALAATVSESLTSHKVIQALSLEAKFADSFGAHGNKSMQDGVKTSRLSAALERKVDVLIAIAIALILWQGSRSVLLGQLTIGGLVIYLAYLKRALKPLQDFAKYTGRISKALAAAERIADVLDQTPEVYQHPDAIEAPRIRGSIEFSDVTFQYENEQTVLNEFSLSIRRGERLAIVGDSGAGKSTLLNLICRLHDPTHGRVSIDGHDVRDWTLKSLRQQMNIVMQDNAIFATTVRENIALGQDNVTDAEIEKAAAIAGAHEFISRLPCGYQTELGELGANLSRGQVQRIAIARATLRPAPIFLIDEPTTGLDEANERLVRDGILRASKGRTTVIVTHQLSLARYADRIILMRHGQILESGNHQELMECNGEYASMFFNQTHSENQQTILA